MANIFNGTGTISYGSGTSPISITLSNPTESNQTIYYPTSGFTRVKCSEAPAYSMDVRLRIDYMLDKYSQNIKVMVSLECNGCYQSGSTLARYNITYTGDSAWGVGWGGNFGGNKPTNSSGVKQSPMEGEIRPVVICTLGSQWSQYLITNTTSQDDDVISRFSMVSNEDDYFCKTSKDNYAAIKYSTSIYLNIKAKGTKKTYYNVTYYINGNQYGTAESYEPNSTVTVKDAPSVEPNKKEEKEDYTATFKVDGNIHATQKGSATWIRTWDPTNIWESNGIGNKKGGDTFTITKDIDFQLKFNENWNDGPKTYTAILQRPTDPEKTGYDFTGWSNSPKFDNYITETKTYNAQFEKKLYTVSFDTVGGSPSQASKYIPYNDTLRSTTGMASLPTLNRQGYKFNGWLASDGSTITVDTHITKNITLVAQWLKVYTLEYKINGGIGDDYSGTRVQGDTTFKLPDGPARGNVKRNNILSYEIDSSMLLDNVNSTTIIEYKFTGWKSNLDGKLYQGVYTVDADTVFTAQWDETYYTSFTPPDVKDKVGYIFKEWTTGESGGGDKYTAKTSYKDIKLKSLILYPQFTAIKNTIIQKYFINTTKTEPETITKTYTIKDNDITLNTPAASFSDDYKFIGWSRGDDKGTAPSEWDKSNKGIYSRDSDAPKDSRLPVIIKPSEMLEENDWGVYGRDASGKLTPYKYGNRNGIGPTWYYYGSWVVSGKYIKVEDVWRRITNTFVKVNGVWKEVTDIYFKNGTWKKEIGKK